MKKNVDRLGVNLIAKERGRQIYKKNYDDAHDDAHDQKELARAAACFVLAEIGQDLSIISNDAMSCFVMAPTLDMDPLEDPQISCWDAIDQIWPWSDEMHRGPRPRNHINNLAKAGALIAAEIDRLVRLEEKENEQSK